MTHSVVAQTAASRIAAMSGNSNFGSARRCRLRRSDGDRGTRVPIGLVGTTLDGTASLPAQVTSEPSRRAGGAAVRYRTLGRTVGRIVPRAHPVEPYPEGRPSNGSTWPGGTGTRNVLMVMQIRP